MSWKRANSEDYRPPITSRNYEVNSTGDRSISKSLVTSLDAQLLFEISQNMTEVNMEELPVFLHHHIS